MGSQINAGDMTKLVTWQVFSSAVTSGSAGQAVKTWASQTPMHYAKFEPLTGMELWNQRQLKATSTTKITMRDVGAISPKDRLLLEGTSRIFNIDSVIDPQELGADLILMATELK